MTETTVSLEMTEQSVFDKMRAALQPSGTAAIVGLGFKMGCTTNAYYKAEYVQKCINLLETKCALAAVGLEPLNDLEKLAAQLLMESAYIKLDPPQHL